MFGDWGFIIFVPKYQKAHPYANTGRIKRLAYVPVAAFLTLYTAPRKRENGQWKLEQCITECLSSDYNHHNVLHCALMCCGNNLFQINSNEGFLRRSTSITVHARIKDNHAKHTA